MSRKLYVVFFPKFDQGRQKLGVAVTESSHILCIVNETPQLPVFAIVFAAGTATRFGSTKQLREYRGKTLVRRATDLASEVCGDHTVLVVGHDWSSVTAACRPLQGFLLLNDHYDDGLSASISRAVGSIQHVASAVILLLADQVLVTADHVQAVRDAYRGTSHEIVATSYANTNGPPILFSQGCFEDLMNLKGDKGARELLNNDRYSVKTLNFESAAVDIDTPADLERLV